MKTSVFFFFVFCGSGFEPLNLRQGIVTVEFPLYLRLFENPRIRGGGHQVLDLNDRRKTSTLMLKSFTLSQINFQIVPFIWTKLKLKK